MRIPLRTGSQYETAMKQPFAGYTTDWTPIDDFARLLTPHYLQQFADVDVRSMAHLSSQDQKHKRAMPTSRNSPYFFWRVGQGTHHGVDFMMPRGTPITCLEGGIVVRTKTRDGVTKNEGNCIVIKTDRCYRSYCHLDTITVKQGQTVTAGTQIGTCGNTGMSTQFHLHLQCDKLTSPFQPYFDPQGRASMIQAHTLDPLEMIKTIPSLPQSPSESKGIFSDLPGDPLLSHAILTLHRRGFIRGHQGKIFPDKPLERYHLVLLVARFASILKLPLGSIVDPNPRFEDCFGLDDEAQEAIIMLARHGIVRGHEGKFSPHGKVRGEEVLAIFGRLLRGINNAPTGNWYDSYVEEFSRRKLISTPWPWIGVSISRAEIFRLMATILPTA
ncbi:MAG: M23 family metallopeptidase [Candidatus Absconditabacterales bacterium]|nr:M23 family metallopeptidase [Candidatus Absconditabacterales bacterium]